MNRWLWVAVAAAAAGAAWCAVSAGRRQPIEASEASRLAHNVQAQTAHRLGEAAFARGDLAEAERGFATAVRLEPRSALAWFNLGNTYTRRGKRRAAVEAFSRCTQLQPRWGEAWQRLADVLADDQQLDAASAAAERATRLAAGTADAWMMRGHVALLQGRFADAERFSRRARDLAPQRPETWLAVGDSLLAVPGNTRAAEAAAAFDRATAIQPNAYGFRRLGEALGRAGRGREAVASLREAVKLAPGDAAAASALSQALSASGEPDEGRRWAAKAKDLQERRYRLLSLERQAEQAPADAEVLSQLAREYANQGDRPAAISAYQRVLMLRPEDETVRKALARLETGRQR